MKSATVAQTIGKQLRIFRQGLVDEGTHFVWIVPTSIKLFACHGEHNLLTAALRLRKIRRPLTIQPPGFPQCIHVYSSFVVKEECAKCLSLLSPIFLHALPHPQSGRVSHVYLLLAE